MKLSNYILHIGANEDRLNVLEELVAEAGLWRDGWLEGFDQTSARRRSRDEAERGEVELVEAHLATDLRQVIPEDLARDVRLGKV